MLNDVGSPGAFLQALQKAAPYAGAAFVFNQTRQPAGQAVIKARQSVGGVVLQRTYVQPCLDNRPVSPDIGAAQVRYPENVDVFLGCHGNVGWGGAPL